jgi:uncharacterized short protein YbdD (DUF466 family)
MSHSGPVHLLAVHDAATASGPARTSRWRAKLQRVIAVVRRIVGVPDYDAYLSHMQRHHPTCTPLDARTFERERLADKYTRPGSRCC